MKNKQLKINYSFLLYLSSIGVLLLLVLELFTSLNFTQEKLSNSFSEMSTSDATWYLQCSREFFKHPSSIFSWNFGTSYWFFPNMFIWIILTLFTSNTALLMILYGIVQMFIILFLSFYLFKLIFPNFSLVHKSISIMLFSFFMINCILCNDYYCFTSNIFLPYHSSSLINTLICLIFGVTFIKKKNGISLFLFCFHTTFSAISNNIFIVYFTIPILACYIVLILLKRKIEKEYVHIVIHTILWSVVGYVLSKLINTFFIPASVNIQFSFKESINCILFLFTHYWKMLITGGLRSLVMSLFLISIIVTAINAIRLLLKSPLNEKGKKHLYYFIFWTLFTILVFIIPAIVTVYNHELAFRYNAAIIYFSIIHLGLLLSYVIQNKKMLNVIAGVLFIVVSSVSIYYTSKANPLQFYEKAITYYPSLVHATDSLKIKYSLKNGLANYWDAGYVTRLSKTGVIVNSVFDNLFIWHNANNIDTYFWKDFDRKQRVEYNFIIADNIVDSSAVYSTFPIQKIKKIVILNHSFWIVPSFILNPQNNTIELL